MTLLPRRHKDGRDHYRYWVKFGLDWGTVMGGTWRLCGLMLITAMGVGEARAAAAGGPNCDGALMMVEPSVAKARDDTAAANAAAEQFMSLIGSPKFLAAAEAGDPLAEYVLAGRSAEKGDHVQELRWLTRAADQGYTKAQLKLALAYMVGSRIPEDYAEAAKWYTRAAQQGNAAAMGALGSIYEHGWGVAQDFVEAHKWLNLVAAEAHPAAEGGHSARPGLAGDTQRNGRWRRAGRPGRQSRRSASP